MIRNNTKYEYEKIIELAEVREDTRICHLHLHLLHFQAEIGVVWAAGAHLWDFWNLRILVVGREKKGEKREYIWWWFHSGIMSSTSWWMEVTLKTVSLSFTLNRMVPFTVHAEAMSLWSLMFFSCLKVALVRSSKKGCFMRLFEDPAWPLAEEVVSLVSRGAIPYGGER